MSDMANYVSNLQLADPMPGLVEATGGAILQKVAGSDTPTPKTEEGFVNLGSTVSFVANVGGQSRFDVLNSTLLAQLAADHEVDREEDPVAWYKQYRDVLGNVGWVIEKFDFVKYKSSGETLEVDKSVINILGAIVGGDKVKIIKATLDALKDLSGKNDKTFTLFDRSSQNKKAGNFQISLVDETNGAVSMTLGAFYFTSQQKSTRFLFAEFSSSGTELYQGAQTVTLNTEIYGDVRALVREKLGKRVADFISRLPKF